jgi:hypothetical protein
MFNLKTKIKELAKVAVVLAEEELSSAAGKQKKALAVEFVISNLPIPFKKLISKLLAGFIDDAIEFALKQMKSFSASEQDTEV